MRAPQNAVSPASPRQGLGVGRVTGLAAASVAGRVPGFLIPILVAAVFGAGGQTDAYFVVYNAVLLVGGTLGQAVDVSIVPFAARRLLMTGGQPAAFLAKTSRRVLLGAGVAWLAIVPILLAASRSFGGAVALYGVAFMPLVLCWTWASVYSGTLVAQGRIAEATASLAWRGIGGLIGLALAPAGAGLWAVGCGLGAGELVRVLWLRRRAFVNAELLQTHASFTPGGSFGRALVPILVAGAAVTAVPVLEKVLALGLGAGAASHLEYATRLLVVPAVLFDGAIAPHFLSAWSQLRATDGRALSRHEIGSALGIAFLTAAPLAGAVWLFAPEVVSVLLHHGRFTALDAASVVALLRLMALAFAGNMCALVTERAYLATQRNTLLATLSLARAGVRLLGIALLLGSAGIRAFPIAYALSEWTYLLVLWSFLPRRPDTSRDSH